MQTPRPLLPKLTHFLLKAFRAGVWEDSIVQFIGYWSYLFALSIIPPFLFLLFMPLPFATVVELTTLLITIYLVVLPTCFGAWDDFSSANLMIAYKNSRNEEIAQLCTLGPDRCDPLYAVLFAMPLMFSAIIIVTILVASFFAERSNRNAFIQKKLLQVSAIFHSPSQVLPSC